MKKLIAFIFIAMFATATFAQDTKAVSKADKKSEAALKHECYMMKEGMLMHCTGDKAEPQKTDVKLKNGMIISTKGEVKTDDGNLIKMENGQCISLMGGIGDCEKMHAKNSEGELTHPNDAVK